MIAEQPEDAQHADDQHRRGPGQDQPEVSRQYGEQVDDAEEALRVPRAVAHAVQAQPVLDREQDREEPLDEIESAAVLNSSSSTVVSMTTATLMRMATISATSKNIPARVSERKMMRNSVCFAGPAPAWWRALVMKERLPWRMRRSVAARAFAL
jgi:hypothetical protein